MLNQYRYSVGKFKVSFHTFELIGSDTVSFLQNQSTFNIKLLSSHAFHLTSFLDPQGRAEVYGWLLRDGESFKYLVPENLKENAIERLNRFLISEDVTISEPLWQEWTIALGPDVNASEHSFSGLMFDEVAHLSPVDSWNASEVDERDVDLWKGLTGWPAFDGKDFKKELITNLDIYSLSVSENKGCYPGQETVSKITTRRGAAFSPVLIEVSERCETGTLTNFEKKIGEVSEVFNWSGKFYLSASILRDFRVEKMNLNFTLNGKTQTGIIRYFPLISGAREEKAVELFHEALEFFKHDNFESAEECFKLSINMDPAYADSYEGLGVLLGRLERFSEAITWMEQLIKIDPSSVLAHTNMSLFLMRLGKIEEAELHKSHATVKSFAKFGEEAKTKEQDAAIQKKKLDEWAQRESMFKQVLEIDSEDTLANYGIGSIAVEKADWQTAVIHLEKVITADSGYSVAYLALGKALKGIGRIDEAKEVWQKGLKVAAGKGDLMPANQMQSELDNLRS